MKRWKKYENEIYNYLSNRFNTQRIYEDVYLKGIYSGVQRQIDILVEYEVLGFTERCIVDCKYYGERLDVKDVEEFYGLVEDVGGRTGLLVTKTGYSFAATNRAKSKNINLEIVNVEALSIRSYYNFECKACSKSFFAIEHGGDVELNGYFQYSKGNERYFIFYGSCNSCFKYYFYCSKCNKITCVNYEPDKDGYWQNTCNGKCSVTFFVKQYQDDFNINQKIVDVGAI